MVVVLKRNGCASKYDAVGKSEKSQSLGDSLAGCMGCILDETAGQLCRYFLRHAGTISCSVFWAREPGKPNQTISAASSECTIEN